MKRPSSCRWCGQPLIQSLGVGRTRQFCNNAHRSSHHLWARRADHPVTLRDLIDRAGLRCGICSGPIDLAATGDLGPAIDHIFPVARGGSNEIDNLQLAHKRCNSMKCARADFTCPPIGSEGDSQPRLPGFSSC